MIDLDGWQEIATTLAKNKLRTALTALGVFWGIFMLIIMLGFGSSLERGVSKNMMGFSSNSIYVWASRTSKPYQGLPSGRRLSFRNDDVQALRSEIPEIASVAPRSRLGGYRGATPVVRGAVTAAFNITGTDGAYSYAQPMRIEHGRFLNDLDLRERRKIAIVGSEVVKQLFPSGEDPIGSSLTVRGVHLQIVGSFSVLTGGHGGDRLANTILMPLSTFQLAFNFGDRIDSMAITAKSGESAEQVEERSRSLLASRHRVAPDDSQAIGSWNLGQEFAKVQSLFDGITTIIWFVGVCTLLAGVIGVSNIMLIAVKERTKEIGVRKALGATPRAIVAMVVRESLILTSLSGYLGLVAGVALLEVVGGLIGDGVGEGGSRRRGGGLGPVFASPDVPLETALIATGALIVAGAVASIIPARHAAQIKPVEALRAE